MNSSPSASDASSATYYFSHVAVTFQAPQEVLAEVQRRWAGCSLPVVPTTSHVGFVVAATPPDSDAGDGHIHYSLICDDGRVQCPTEVASPVILSEIERALYGSLRRWHQDAGTLLLHAALVAKDGVAVVFVGPSGAGKSSMTLAAVRAGWRYGSDDITVTDGRQFWGISRPLQFDPIGPNQPTIVRLRDLERLVYTVHLEDGDVVQPASILTGDALMDAPSPVEAVRIVSLQHATSTGVNSVTKHATGETTASLVGASYDWPACAVHWPSALGQGFTLSWTQPSEAMARLEEALGL